jgi:hypothetical protein
LGWWRCASDLPDVSNPVGRAVILVSSHKHKLMLARADEVVE